MKTKTLIATLALAFLASPAVAADLGGPKTKAPAKSTAYVDPAPQSRPTCYIDAGAAFGSSVADLKSADGKVPFSPSGVMGQLGAGCDLIPMGNFVVGAFGLYNVGELKSSATFGADKLDFMLNKNWAVGVRAGVLLQPTTLLYGRFGYTGANAEIKSAEFKLDRNLHGVIMGVGIETQIAGPLALRIAGDYYKWQDQKFEDGVKGVGGMFTGTTSLVYKF